MLVFTASGTQETLTIKPQHTSGNCATNFALGVSPLDMIKTATLDGTSAGEPVTFTMTIENTGIETLTDVRISEDILERGDGTPLSLTTGPSFVSNSGSSPQGILQPGEKATFTATYALTQADIEVGRLTNQAVGVGTSPTIGEMSAYSSAAADAGEGPTEVTIPKTPAIRLDKAGTPVDTNGNGVTDAGDEILYTFTVTNSGNVALTDITVNDTTPGVTVSGGPIANLAPGVSDSTAFSASYTLTQADIDGGRVQNTASAAGTSVGGVPVDDEASVTVVLERILRLSLHKEGEISDDNGNGALDAGETLTYTFAVTNTGNVTLTDVTLDDPGVTVSGGPIASLAPGETDDTTYTATYVVTQADVDNGVYLNTATVSGNGPASTSVIARDSATVPAEAAGKLRLEKNGDYVDANGNGIIDAGDRVDYTFVVTNAGNVTLSNVVVTDPDATVSGGPIASLAPGGSDGTTFTATLDLTQEHVDAGRIENTATATGLTPGGDTVTGEGSKSLVLAANERIALEKIAAHVDTNGNGIADVGDHIAYSFTVTNTGNVTLTGVSLDDPGVTVSGGPIASLRPGEADGGTFTASYPLTQADVDAGRVSNTATVTGTAPDGHSVEDTAQAVIIMEGSPDLSLVKTGEYRDANGNGAIDAGDEIVYEFAITNTGTVTLASVAPKDAGPLFDGKAGTGSLSDFTPASADLAPGASQTFAAAYRMSGEDIANVQTVENGIRNTATAEGTDPMGQPVESAEAWSVVDIFSEPDFEIGKTAAFVQVQRGQRVPYTIRVRMSGLLRASVVNVVDEIPAGFAFVQGSATIDGTVVAPRVDGRRLTFENVPLSPNVEAGAIEAEIEIGLSLTVSAAAGPGEYVNRTWVESPSGERLTPVATATVEVVVEPVFDCGDVIGKVFDDANRNGYQDDGERGLPGVRVATVSGLLITTDRHGRFHVACADLPDQRIGSTFIMKLDPRTLPTGYRMVSENPRTVRLTAGKASLLNFAASLGRIVRLDLTEAAYEPGSARLRPEWQAGLGRLVTLLAAEPSTLRLAYIDQGTDRRTAKARTRTLRAAIDKLWKQAGNKYPLDIETSIETGRPAGRGPIGDRGAVAGP
ncbi:DUF7507 domain-containing protein [Nitratireductor thuwali]|uniref:DUF7507 domain-containing protein n=1 Tax=Nitratireductor thuwali TaxID=2267699 RepID=UPI0030D40D74